MIEGLSAAFKAPFSPAKPAKTNFKNLLEALPRVAVRKDEKAIYLTQIFWFIEVFSGNVPFLSRS